jgi:hypothetical protein
MEVSLITGGCSNVGITYTRLCIKMHLSIFIYYFGGGKGLVLVFRHLQGSNVFFIVKFRKACQHVQVQAGPTVETTVWSPAEPGHSKPGTARPHHRQAVAINNTKASVVPFPSMR